MGRLTKVNSCPAYVVILDFWAMAGKISLHFLIRRL